MPITSSIKDSVAELVFTEKLIFSDAAVFRKLLLAALTPQVKKCVFDVAKLTYMDSSGLGMIMVALKECQQRGVSLEIHHPTADVKSLLEMTKTHERIRIVP